MAEPAEPSLGQPIASTARRRRPELVSVVVPVLDEEEHIAEQLEALAAQRYPGAWELLLVDNGSTDRSLGIASGFAGRLPLRIVDASDRRGLNHARNVGAANAAGDFLAFCDADDVVSPGWLAALVAAADQGDIVAGSLDFASLNEELQRAWQPDDPMTELPVAHGFLPYAPGGNCGVWTEIARELGWDEDFRFGSSDIEFSWRAQLAGRRVVFAPAAVVCQRYRRTLRGLARQYFAYGRSGPQLSRRFAEHGMLPDRELRAQWRWLVRRARDLLGPRERRGNWIRIAAMSLGRLAGSVRRRPKPSSPGGIRLLEVGLGWPPETFLVWKLEDLAARGFQVVVASPIRRSGAGARLRGVRLARVPRWDESPLVKLLGGIGDALALLVSDRDRFRRLLTALRSRTGPDRPRSAVALIGQLRSYAGLARMRPDVVHFEWESAAVFHLPLLDVWRCPVVVSCHGAGVNVYPSSDPEARAVTELRQAFGRASAVHCVSEAVVSEAERHGLEPGKACLIRPAVDASFFSPDGARRADRTELRVVSVGDLIWVKGYEYGVEAIGLLVRQGVPARLDILGGEPHRDHGARSDRERIEHTIADLGLRDRVRLHGLVPSSEVRDSLRQADVFLHASLSEGIPTAALEAMACGLPVVTTDCGGVREAVRDGVDGFVVPLRDASALAEALRMLAARPELRRRMGASGRARVSTAFTLAAQLEAYVALYERALGRPAGQG